MKKKILVVVADYYKDISSDLIFGAKNVLLKKNLKYKIQEKFIKVPGSFEIPVVISKNAKKYDGFIALGCVIKGETPHFDFISQAVTNEIMKLSTKYKKPIGNGILTCLNKEQAIKRSKTKGIESAKAVIAVLNIF